MTRDRTGFNTLSTDEGLTDTEMDLIQEHPTSTHNNDERHELRSNFSEFRDRIFEIATVFRCVCDGILIFIILSVIICFAIALHC